MRDSLNNGDISSVDYILRTLTSFTVLRFDIFAINTLLLGIRQHIVLFRCVVNYTNSEYPFARLIPSIIHGWLGSRKHFSVALGGYYGSPQPTMEYNSTCWIESSELEHHLKCVPCMLYQHTIESFTRHITPTCYEWSFTDMGWLIVWHG